MPKTDREILEEFMVSREGPPAESPLDEYGNQLHMMGRRSLERLGATAEDSFSEGRERLGQYGDEAAVIDPSLLYPGAGQASPHGDDIYGGGRPKLESEGYHDNTMDELRRLRELGHDYYQGRRMVDPRERPPQSFINRE